MRRAISVALGIGLAIGGSLYVVFDSNLFLIAAVVALYTGWGYFAVRYRRLLLREFPQFDRSMDRLGYAIGLFGVSIGPVAFSQQFTASDISITFFIGYLGVVGFLSTSTAAGSDSEAR
ncbi:hypothetical protein [Natrialba asiatica]|uniref:Uncharacterized protein n=1 Tax=Natrialba asiatica (strain ATCC 700177 / DSM 12278 / JCM 9576 / FERM P-10747 / NBRC 102637 / 172P1) TaxID=29540 RepID=M0B1P1_NATA1|nr:hypothetical protein [Natrialba asiatica]ELZ04695.1 hypothetical protein C481_04096 [Natrialba asiatica DSM 12278]